MSCSLATLVLSLIFGFDSAIVCGIGSCDLPAELHLENGRYDTLPADEWSWMNHDLALARVALANGDHNRAENIGRWLEHAIDLRMDAMVDGRGKLRVKALNRAVNGIISGSAIRTGGIAGFKGSSSEIPVHRPGAQG